MFIRPWNKEAERILFDLSRDGRAYTSNRKIVRTFGCKHREIIDNGFLDIATTRYNKRKDKAIFVTTPGTIVLPKTNERGVNFHFKRFKIL